MNYRVSFSNISHIIAAKTSQMCNIAWAFAQPTHKEGMDKGLNFYSQPDV